MASKNDRMNRLGLGIVAHFMFLVFFFIVFQGHLRISLKEFETLVFVLNIKFHDV